MSIAASLDFGSRLRKPAAVAPEFAALEGVPLFAGVPAHVLAALAARTSVRHLSRRGVLAAEGSVPSQLFVVLRGKVRAVRRSDSGREVTLETFQPGDLLADALAAPDRPLSNDWEAIEPTDVLAIARDAFIEHLQSAPAVALTLIAGTLDRLERSKGLAAGLALADVPGRVIGALRAMAQSQGQDAPDGVTVHNRPTQQELANSIGACRETVSRVISDLARRGLITPRGRSLLISRRLLSGSGS
jgi:CRP/FNR family cyclic AMP-dependent transcriptional regulator